MRNRAVVKQMIDECAAKGYEVDRAEAIKLLSIHLPEINVCTLRLRNRSFRVQADA